VRPSAEAGERTEWRRTDQHRRPAYYWFKNYFWESAFYPATLRPWSERTPTHSRERAKILCTFIGICPNPRKSIAGYRPFAYPPYNRSQRGLIAFLQLFYIIWLVYGWYIISLPMITGLDLNPRRTTYDSTRIPLDRPMIRDSTQGIRIAYSRLWPPVLCLIEHLFTYLCKSLIYNALWLLAQLPYRALARVSLGVGIGSCHTPFRIDCRGSLHFYILFTIMYRDLARYLLPVF